MWYFKPSFFFNKKVLAFKNIKYLAEIHTYFIPYL